MSEEKVIISDVDALLEGTLDDIADLPEFKPFCAGTHRCMFNWAMKAVDSEKINACEIKLKAIETVELPAGSKDEPLSPGQSTNILLFLVHQNEQAMQLGQGRWKELIEYFKGAYEMPEEATNRQVMAEADGAEVIVTTEVRDGGKKNPGKKYTEITNLVLYA